MTSAPSTPVLEESSLIAQGIYQGYGKRAILEDVSIALAPGITALLGPNGAGKTTLLRTLTTTLRPKKGRLFISGNELINSSSIRSARRDMGYLAQGFTADPSFTVQNMVSYAAWLRGLETQEIPALVALAVESVGLTKELNTRAKKLSGGMQQRLGVACAVVGSPKILVLDEPTVGLDPDQRALFRELLISLKSSTVLLSTHLIEDVANLADRVIILFDGAILFDGTVAELRAHAPLENQKDNDLEAAYLAITRSASKQ